MLPFSKQVLTREEHGRIVRACSTTWQRPCLLLFTVALSPSPQADWISSRSNIQFLRLQLRAWRCQGHHSHLQFTEVQS